MSVGIIIPMYNFNDMTRICIDFVVKNAGMSDYNILVIDDGSTIPFADDRVSIIRNHRNMGFTYSVNKGIEYDNNKSDYIMILNNDTEPREGFLDYLVKFMDANQDVAIASPARIVPMNGKGSYEMEGLDWLRGHSLIAWQKETAPRFCEWVPFCCVLIRTSVIREIGILDKRLKNYCSDGDYCSRVRMAGYKVAVVPESEILHYRGTTIIDNREKLEPLLSEDQKRFIEKLSGYNWNLLLDKMPLDIEKNLWGNIQFETYVKS